MFEIISSHPKLFLGVFTPVILCIGYFYRYRKEKKENLKAALYVILEIWHRMAVFYRRDFDDFFDVLTEVLHKKVPEVEFTEEQRRATKEYFIQILKDSSRSSAFSDFEQYQQSFDNAIKLIAGDDPFFAYKIGSAGKTKKFLKALDQYLESALSPLEAGGADSLVLSKTLKQHVTSYASVDILSDLERNIYQLSFKISFFTYLRSLLAVRSRKKKLSMVSRNEVESLVESVLFPAIVEFDKQRQATL